MQLRCEAGGNPTPSRFVWTKDGANLGTGQTFQVRPSHLAEGSATDGGLC